MFNLKSVFKAGSVSNHGFMDVHNAKRVAGTMFHSPVVVAVEVTDTSTNGVVLSLSKNQVGQCVERVEA